MKKKMLFITRKYPPSIGGMENGLYNIAKGMQDENLDVKIVALGKSQKNLIWFLPYVLIYILFNASKYDYLFLGDGLICMYGKIAKIVNPKIFRIIILHGLDVSFANPIYQFYLKRNLKKAADIYACNSHYTEDVARKWGLNEGLCTVTHGIDIHKYDDANPINNDIFRKKYNIPVDDLIIITAGRLVKRKGVEWFVRNVMPKLKHVTYLIIGTGEEQENINRAIHETTCVENIKMLGRISDKELEDCYFNADVFVMPNYHEENNAEGFGLVALEASLAGLIVIASNVDGIPDAVTRGKNGFLIESKNAKQYISLIKKIQANLSEYKQEGKAFRKYTIDNYSWEVTCSNLKRKLYDRG